MGCGQTVIAALSEAGGGFGRRRRNGAGNCRLYACGETLLVLLLDFGFPPFLFSPAPVTSDSADSTKWQKDILCNRPISRGIGRTIYLANSMCIHHIASLVVPPPHTHTSPANPSKLALSHYDKNMTAPSSPTFSSRPSWSVVSFAYECGRWRHGNPKKGCALTNPPPFCAVKLSPPLPLFSLEKQ